MPNLDGSNKGSISFGLGPSPGTADHNRPRQAAAPAAFCGAPRDVDVLNLPGFYRRHAEFLDADHSVLGPDSSSVALDFSSFIYAKDLSNVSLYAASRKSFRLDSNFLSFDHS